MSYIGNEPTSVAFLTDTFSGNGSTTAFTLSAAPATTSSILVAISGVLQDPSTYSVVGTTLTFSPAPPTGTGNISVRFLGIPASGVTTTAYRTVTEFTATSGQTTFSVPSYTPGFIDVYRNGVMLGSADYTATNGLSVVLANPCTVGDFVEVISFSVSSVLNAIPNVPASVNTSNLVDGSVTTAKIAAGAVITADIADGAVTSAKLATGQTLSVNGITFPATQVPSADANTLDDYEEGSFTPFFANDSGLNIVGAYTRQTGRYTKVGNLVNCSIHIITASSWSYQNGANGSTSVNIGGLPFTSTNQLIYPSGSCGYYNSLNGWSAGYTPMGYVELNTSLIRLTYAGANNIVRVNASLIFNGNSEMLFSVSYFTN